MAFSGVLSCRLAQAPLTVERYDRFVRRAAVYGLTVYRTQGFRLV